MAYFFVIGNTLVHPDEYQSKLKSGEVRRFRTALAARSKAQQKAGTARARKAVSLEFTTGSVTDEQVLTARQDAAPDFQPVGIGRPLSIEIAGIYTGDAPNSALGQKPDLLVTSAVKSLVTFDAAPRAINQLIRKVKDVTYYPPSALNQGCPIVYYTPALADETLLCSFELLAENFTSHSASVISKLMAAAGGLPVFAPASLYLIAGSELTKIIGDLSKLIPGKQPFLRDDLNLYFSTPGLEPGIAHAAVIYNQSDEGELSHCKVDKIGRQSRVRLALVDGEGNEYQGPAPYMIALIDGRARPDLAGFSPRLASAALLERFYTAGSEAEGKLDTIFTAALELYNDYTFRLKAEDFKNQISALDSAEPGYAAEKARLEKLMAACKGNIRTEVLKK